MVLRTVRNISLTREGKRWYVSFCVEGTFTLPNAGEASVGLPRIGVVERARRSGFGSHIGRPVRRRIGASICRSVVTCVQIPAGYVCGGCTGDRVPEA